MSRIICTVAGTASRTLVATALEGRVELFDPIARAEDQYPLRADRVRVSALCEIPTAAGSLLATGGAEGIVRLWDVVAGAEVGSGFTGSGSPITALCAVAMGERTALAVGDKAGGVLLLDTADGTVLGTLDAGSRPVIAVCSTRPGVEGTPLVTGCADGTVRLWDPTSATVLAEHHELGTTTFALCVVTGPDGGPLVALDETGSALDEATRVAVLAVPTLARAAEPWPDGSEFSVRSLFPVPGRGLGIARSNGIRIWDATTGTAGPLLDNPDCDDACAVPTSTGPIVVVAEGTSIRLWDPGTGTEMAGMVDSRKDSIAALGHVGRPPSNTLVTVGAWTRRWRPDTGIEVGRPIAAHVPSASRVCAVTLPGGHEAFVTGGADGLVQLWDADTGAPLSGALGDASGFSVTAMTAYADATGRTLVAVGDSQGTVRLWDLIAGSLVAGPVSSSGTGDRTLLICLTATADGTDVLVTLTANGEIRLDDPATLVPRQPLPGASGPLPALSAACTVPTADGRTLVAARTDTEVLLLDPLTGDIVGARMPSVPERTIALGALSTTDGRTLLAVPADRSVQLWDTATGQPFGPPLDGTWPVKDLCPVPAAGGRTLLAVADAYEIQQWDPTTGMPVGSPINAPAVTSGSLCLVPGPAGGVVLASGGDDGAVRRWDLTSGAPAGRPMIFHGKLNPIGALCTVPVDGRVLVAAGGMDSTVRLWDPVNGSPVGHLFTGAKRSVLALSSVADGPEAPLLVGMGNSAVVVWDVMSGDALTTISQPSQLLRACVLPDVDGRAVLAISQSTGAVVLHDPRTGDEVGRLAPGARIRLLAAIPGVAGRTVLARVTFDGKLSLLDPITGELVAAPAGPTVAAVCGLPDVSGRTLVAAGDEDGVIRLFVADTGELAGPPLRGHAGQVTALAALHRPGSPTLLGSAAEDGTIRIWDPMAPSGPLLIL